MPRRSVARSRRPSGGGPKQALRELSNTYDLSGLVDRLEPDFRAVEESIKSSGRR